MARQRVAELVRTLNAAPQPIYLLDDEYVVVFCNRACREWLGEAAEGLVGTQCVYGSSVDRPDTQVLASGLCPPPGAMLGREQTGIVARVLPAGKLPDGELPDDRPPRRRSATFVPVAAGLEDLVVLVVILGTEDLPESAADAQPPLATSPVEADAAKLHEQVGRFRREAAARYGAEELIGQCPAMRRARAQIEVAAGSHASVLLLGPTGSGRQHAAAAIHYAGDPRRQGTLIPLDCSVLGAELVRSTVAALAGGDALGKGAQRSTLLLNQADRLPPDVQAELAPLLLRRSFVPRLIATAERPLTELARTDTYRDDLAAGLSTITIELPPLGQRRGDLPLLAQLFVERANAQGTRQLGGFTADALDRLDAYAWPGNVDELAQVVAEAHAGAEGPLIDADDLPERIHLAADADARPHRPPEKIVLDDFLADVEKELIHRALREAKGNKAQAARLLGISRPRLYRRAVQLGLVDDV